MEILLIKQFHSELSRRIFGEKSCRDPSSQPSELDRAGCEGILHYEYIVTFSVRTCLKKKNT